MSRVYSKAWVSNLCSTGHTQLTAIFHVTLLYMNFVYSDSKCFNKNYWVLLVIYLTCDPFIQGQIRCQHMPWSRTPVNWKTNNYHIHKKNNANTTKANNQSQNICAWGGRPTCWPRTFRPHICTLDLPCNMPSDVWVCHIEMWFTDDSKGQMLCRPPLSLWLTKRIVPEMTRWHDESDVPSLPELSSVSAWIQALASSTIVAPLNTSIMFGLLLVLCDFSFTSCPHFSNTHTSMSTGRLCP